LRADFAASSASSLPLMPIWLGIQIRIMVFPEFDSPRKSLVKGERFIRGLKRNQSDNYGDN